MKLISYRMSCLDCIQREGFLFLKTHLMLFLEVQKRLVEFLVVLLTLRGFDKIGSWYFGNLLGDDRTCVKLRRWMIMCRMSRMGRLGGIIVRKVTMCVVRMGSELGRWVLLRSEIRIRIHRIARIVHIVSIISSMRWVQ